jgi:hypothetical protein
MRSKLLFTSAAVVAIVAGASLASGQGTSPGMNDSSKSSQPSTGQRGQGTVGQSSGAQQRPDHGAPSAAQRQEKSSAGQKQEKETTGQAPAGRESAEPKQQQHQDKGSAGKPSAAQPQKKNERETTGQAPAEPRHDMQRQSPSTQGQAKPSGPRAGETTGAAHANVQLSTEQRTRIRETVRKESNAPRIAKADFDLSVGTVVPSSVHYVRLPDTIVEIYPAWRGFDYVMVGDAILVLDPRDHRIVAVLDA